MLLLGLCAPGTFYALQLGCFCIQRWTDFVRNKTDHNINKAAAEGGIVKISVIALCPWAPVWFYSFEG